MAKVRQDAWTEEDDLLLAETVLRHIRDGSTQLNAFDEVGDKLNRTSAACGFRWNAEVRNRYHSAIELAKRQRKEKKRKEAQRHKMKRERQSATSKNSFTRTTDPTLVIHDESMTIDDVIQFLTNVKESNLVTDEQKITIDTLQTENDHLKEQVKYLEKELSATKNRLKTVEEDYQTFIQIMERARKMTVLEDQDHLTAPTFRMDKNGNLEQFAQGME